MDELGYRPNKLARGLSMPRTGTVGVLLNDLRNPWFVELLEGLTASLHAAGVSPVLADSYTDQQGGPPFRGGPARTAHRRARGRGDHHGISRHRNRCRQLCRSSWPEPSTLPCPGVDIVVNDDEAGARKATGHLLALGHRRIAHLQGPGEIGRLRRAGYEHAMAAAGLEPWVVPAA